MRVAASTVIGAEADKVFGFISAPENGPRWQEGAVSTRVTSPGPVALGTQMEHTGRWLGLRIQTRAIVTVFEPASAFGYDITSSMSPAPSRMRYALERVPRGTGLTLSNEFALPWFVMPFAPLLRQSVQRMFERDLARLGDVIEAESPTFQSATTQPQPAC